MWQSKYTADFKLMKSLTKICHCWLLAIMLLMVQSASVVSACPQGALAPHSRWQVTARDTHARYYSIRYCTLHSPGHLSLTRAPVPPRMALLSLGCGVVSAIKPRTLQRSTRS